MDPQVLMLIPLIFLAALLYSSVGHGGASAYLAVMALAGVAPMSMRPAALSLNVLVASIAIYKFYKVHAFSWPLFTPLALASVPFAFIGGLIALPNQHYKSLVGVVLIYAAWHMFQHANQANSQVVKPASKVMLLTIGSVLGLLSGLTGVGGGIFLSPLLLFFNWAETRVVSGIAAAFILVNSISGLLGLATKHAALPDGLPYWAVAAVAGGLIGAEFGSKRLANSSIRKVLAVVLVIAGIKMVISG